VRLSFAAYFVQWLDGFFVMGLLNGLPIPPIPLFTESPFLV